MVVDVPNLYTLPIELGVAFMILVMDKRSRKLEQHSIIRGQELEHRQREAQQLQMERFSSWIQENSKRQVMLLESIMGALGTDHRDAFASQVSTRYKEEISRDLEELEDLLEKKELAKDQVDLKLDNEIDTKIDEIDSAQEIASSFFPPNLIQSLKKVSNTAKNSFSQLQKLSEIGEINFDFNDLEGSTKRERHPGKEKPLEEFHIEKEKLAREMEELKSEIQQSIADTTSQIGSKIASLFSPKGIEKGLKDLIKKEKEKSENDEVAN